MALLHPHHREARTSPRTGCGQFRPRGPYGKLDCPGSPVAGVRVGRHRSGSRTRRGSPKRMSCRPLCPSGTDSYVCGDLGYACRYPAYSSPSPTYPSPYPTPTSSPTYTPASAACSDGRDNDFDGLTDRSHGSGLHRAGVHARSKHDGPRLAAGVEPSSRAGQRADSSSTVWRGRTSPAYETGTRGNSETTIVGQPEGRYVDWHVRVVSSGRREERVQVYR